MSPNAITTRIHSNPSIFRNRNTLKLCKILTLTAAGIFLSGAVNAQVPSESPGSKTTETVRFLDLVTEEQLDGPEKDPLQAVIEQQADNNLWHEYPIDSNDSIEKIFLNEGLSQLDLMKLLEVEDGIGFLTNLNNAEYLRYQLNDNNRLILLDIRLNSGEVQRFERHDTDDFTLNSVERIIKTEVSKIEGSIVGSFYQSGKRAGLSVSTIQQYANIFQWQINFNRDLRTGDRFELLLQQPSEKSNGNTSLIVAARLIQKNRTFTAIRYNDGQYYTEKGRLLGSSFSRFPLSGTERVSSGFNLKRKHPITGKVRAHKGTDWAAPIGTPIVATADGMVIKAVKNHPAAGNYLEIRNGRRYVTRFLHMNALNVKAGDMVKQGDIIGTTGNTGLSTGPHLHYEMYVDGRPVNAMKVKLPAGNVLEGRELEEFVQLTRPIVVRLSETKNKRLSLVKN